MPRKRKGRAVNGILLVDKQQGQSSNHVVQQVKRLFNAQKPGHTGALDPLATGLLPVCLGEATKFSQYLLETDKEYEVIAKLGERTDTSDADGEIVERRELPVLTDADIDKLLDNFRGPLKQTPSVFSALKYQGKPLYWYARKGIDVPRPTRDIEVFNNSILSFNDDSLQLKIHCSKGTYIRTIVDDLGELMGCGAHVLSLRRTKVNSFENQEMHDLSKFDALKEQSIEERDFQRLDRFLLPMDIQVKRLRKVILNAKQADLFQHGGQISMKSEVFVKDEALRIYDENEQFLGTAFVNLNLEIQPKRVVVIEH